METFLTMTYKVLSITVQREGQESQTVKMGQGGFKKHSISRSLLFAIQPNYYPILYFHIYGFPELDIKGSI